MVEHEIESGKAGKAQRRHEPGDVGLDLLMLECFHHGGRTIVRLCLQRLDGDAGDDAASLTQNGAVHRRSLDDRLKVDLRRLKIPTQHEGQRPSLAQRIQNGAAQRGRISPVVETGHSVLGRSDAAHAASAEGAVRFHHRGIGNLALRHRDLIGRVCGQTERRADPQVRRQRHQAALAARHVEMSGVAERRLDQFGHPARAGVGHDPKARMPAMQPFGCPVIAWNNQAWPPFRDGLLQDFLKQPWAVARTDAQRHRLEEACVWGDGSDFQPCARQALRHRGRQRVQRGRDE